MDINLIDLACDDFVVVTHEDRLTIVIPTPGNQIAECTQILKTNASRTYTQAASKKRDSPKHAKAIKQLTLTKRSPNNPSNMPTAHKELPANTSNPIDAKCIVFSPLLVLRRQILVCDTKTVYAWPFYVK